WWQRRQLRGGRGRRGARRSRRGGGWGACPHRARTRRSHAAAGGAPGAADRDARLMSDADIDELQARWGQDLAAWAIPEHILAQAAESPWQYPVRVFTRRADDQLASPSGPSYERALEALPAGGSVLDIGSGAGVASLPLGERAERLVAVDPEQAMPDAHAGPARRCRGGRPGPAW